MTKYLLRFTQSGMFTYLNSKWKKIKLPPIKDPELEPLDMQAIIVSIGLLGIGFVLGAITFFIELYQKKRNLLII